MNTEFEKVISAANDMLPAELQKIGVIADRALVLRLVADDTPYYLYLVPGRMRTAVFSGESPGKNYRHAEWLGPHLHTVEHQKATQISCDSEENVAKVHFETGMILYIHFLGSEGNGVLVDPENKILVAWHKAHYYSAGTDYVRGGKSGVARPEIRVRPSSELVLELERLEHEDTCQLVARHLASEHKRLIRRMERIKQDLVEADNGEKYGQWGELLKVNYHLLKRGMDEVRVTDYFSPEMQEVFIPLHSAKAPQENIASYFHRSQKAVRAQAKVQERLEITRQELEENEQNRNRYPDTDDIRELRSMLPKKKKKSP